MALEINQFEISRVKGQIQKTPSPNVITAVIKRDSTETFGSGTAVKLVDIAGKQQVVEKAAANDEIYGFIVYNIKDNSPKAGDIVTVAFDNTFMVMEANAAIAAGAKLEIVATGDKIIAHGGGSNKKVGYAVEKAAASGDLITVHIKTPLI